MAKERRRTPRYRVRKITIFLALKQALKLFVCATMFTFFVLLTVICLLGIDVFAAGQHVAGLDISNLHQLEECTEEPETIPEVIETEEPQQSSDWVYIGKFEITFYCSCTRCTGNGMGITASGQPVQAHKTIAVDTSVIPFGTKVKIAGLDYEYEAMDTGGAIKGNRIDVYMLSHELALQYGRLRNVDVWSQQ